jgi:hypothetical protein
VRLGAVIAALVAFVATVERREKPMRGTGRWSRHLAGLALLLVLPARVAALTDITNGNVAAAVTAWIGGDATTYGNIADWNTAAVTTMANLFYPSSTARPTFNADISKWNVASVSNMYQVDPPLSRAPSAAPGMALRHRWVFQYGTFWPRRMLLPYSDSCLAAMPAHTLCAAASACHFHGLAWDGALAFVLHSFLENTSHTL